MKKVFVVLISLVLMLTFMTTVSMAASLTTSNQNGVDVLVEYDLGDSYVITIPDRIDFDTGTIMYGWVNATDLCLAHLSTLKVLVKSTHGGEMHLHNELGQPVNNFDPITYKLFKGTSPEPSEPVDIGVPLHEADILTTTINTAEDLDERVMLKFVMDDHSGANLASGHYKDTLVFIARLTLPVSTP